MMTDDERHQMELTVRTTLRNSLNVLQERGKTFKQMRMFILEALNQEQNLLADAHKLLLNKIPKADFYNRAIAKKAYIQTMLALNNVEDAMLSEIDFRQEKNAAKKNQPA